MEREEMHFLHGGLFIEELRQKPDVFFILIHSGNNRDPDDDLRLPLGEVLEVFQNHDIRNPSMLPVQPFVHQLYIVQEEVGPFRDLAEKVREGMAACFNGRADSPFT